MPVYGADYPMKMAMSSVAVSEWRNNDGRFWALVSLTAIGSVCLGVLFSTSDPRYALVPAAMVLSMAIAFAARHPWLVLRIVLLGNSVAQPLFLLLGGSTIVGDVAMFPFNIAVGYGPPLLVAVSLIGNRRAWRDLARREVAVSAVFVMLSLASLSYSPDISNGLKGLFQLTQPLAVYAVTLMVVKTDREVDQFRRWMTISAWLGILFGGMLVAIGRASIFVGTAGSILLPIPRMTIALLATWYYLRATAHGKRSDFIQLLAFVSLTVLSGSRTVIAMWLAGMLVVMWHYSQRGRAILLPIALLVLLFALPDEIGRIKNPGVGLESVSIGEVLAAPEEVFQVGTIYDRFNVWMVAGDQLLEAPIVGKGWGVEGVLLGSRAVVGGTQITHNSMLTVLVSVGLLGSLVFVVLHGFLVNAAIRAGRWAASAVWWECGVLALAFFAAYVVGAQTANMFSVYLDAGTPVYMMLGCAAKAVLDGGHADTGERGAVRRRWHQIS